MVVNTAGGSGFASSKTITATFAGLPITLSGATSTDATGSFSGATFTVLSSVAGAKTVIITDANSNSASATFNVRAPFGLDGVAYGSSGTHGQPTLTLKTTQPNDVIILSITQDHTHLYIDGYCWHQLDREIIKFPASRW